MTPGEALVKLILGLLLIGAFQLVSVWIAVKIQEATVDPVNAYARRLARQVT